MRPGRRQAAPLPYDVAPTRSEIRPNFTPLTHPEAGEASAPPEQPKSSPFPPAYTPEGGGFGWQRTEISTLFELPTPTHRAGVARSLESRTKSVTSSLLTDFSAPVLSTPSVAVAPSAERPRRVFKNITDVGESSLFDSPLPPGPPAGPTAQSSGRDEAPASSPDSSADSLRARLRHKLAEERSQSETTIETQEEAPAPLDEYLPILTEDLAAALTQDAQEQSHSDATIAPGADTEVEPSADPAPDSAPASESKPETPAPLKAATQQEFAESDHEGPWELRVEALRYDPVDKTGLAMMLKSGVWADALELLTASGHWIPLSRHPIYPEVRQILLQQTQEVVAQVITGEWAREPETPPREALEAARTVEAPRTPEQPAPKAAAPQEVAPTARQARAWMPSPIWLFIAILTGIAFGLLALAIFQPGLLRANNNTPPAPASKPAPETRPTLATPAPTESDDMSAEIAMARARAEVSRAHGAIQFSQGLIAAERPKMAREVVLKAMLANGVRPELKEAFNQAIAADPALHAAPLTLAVNEPVQKISPLGGGRSISFKVTHPGNRKSSFKPAQDEWGQGWRGELAAYHFCEVVPCHFEAPRNRAARISRAHFEAYYTAGKGDWRASYTDRFAAIHWVREAGPDGVVRDYMYGTLEDWVPHFVEWPIEYTEVYEDLLDIRFHPDDLKIPYAELLAPFETLGEGRFHATLLADQGEASTRDIARQISSLLVFDFLTQNWDRFSSTEKYYGVNNQFGSGIFISIDNGAAFTDEDMSITVTPRFELTSRFSHSMVTAIRALDPAVVNEVLFPNANLNARRRLQLFWRQRDAMLKRVDALVEKYGPERVYEFD